MKRKMTPYLKSILCGNPIPLFADSIFTPLSRSIMHSARRNTSSPQLNLRSVDHHQWFSHYYHFVSNGKEIINGNSYGCIFKAYARRDWFTKGNVLTSIRLLKFWKHLYYKHFSKCKTCFFSQRDSSF